jgi:nitrogenase molybdenum-iron protein alpha/beta subunit
MIESYEQKGNWPFLLGVYMGINAVEDAFCIVDSPDCAFFKAEHIQGNHDRASSLLNVNGQHRIVNTRADVGNIINDRRTIVQSMAQDVYDHPGTASLFTTSMPMAMVTGVEYGLLMRQCQEQGKTWKPTAEIPCQSLSGDWLDGYADFMTAMAGALDLSQDKRQKNTIAIVGNMMDRVEADGHANVRELTRMAEAIGLSVSSVWLSGQKTAPMNRVQEASLIVSHPYGRDAAQRVSERTGADLIELDLPFGLRGSETWIRALAEATGKTKEAETFIDQTLSQIIPRLEWAVQGRLVGKKMVVAADPHLTYGWTELLKEVGANVTMAINYGREGHREEMAQVNGGTTLLHEPPLSRLRTELRTLFHNSAPPDLLISNSQAFQAADLDWPKFLEFGYPSYHTYALHEAPFLGFEGATWALEQVVNRLGLLAHLSPYRPE